MLADGLYRVETPRLCGGFVVERGVVTECAPILRRHLEYWMTVAVRIGEAGSSVSPLKATE